MPLKDEYHASPETEAAWRKAIDAVREAKAVLAAAEQKEGESRRAAVAEVLRLAADDFRDVPQPAVGETFTTADDRWKTPYPLHKGIKYKVREVFVALDGNPRGYAYARRGDDRVEEWSGAIEVHPLVRVVNLKKGDVEGVQAEVIGVDLALMVLGRGERR